MAFLVSDKWIVFSLQRLKPHNLYHRVNFVKELLFTKPPENGAVQFPQQRCHPTPRGFGEKGELQ
ncbi:hypothetical protein G3W18_24490 [Klebsiella pneumoniae]|uniref:Uncharacterized protein n=2 Tax=Klebsiella quasipneumoniae TaxID=1463165 RepID=A0AAW8XXP5_9ENTR|nr:MULTISPECIES: hypothetical protein [Enterobacteriaceae]HCB0627814.1 hypothetical protein [Klebsiella variicola subsp. variicola]AWE05017.1 hypothetical protein AM458_31410 [Klebsiella pneumoniae]MBC5106579.1 hypothetical protein [Klebsiella pneumoniae]MBC5150472.1 hypothetical protein [Klebsiella quasipneumoniae]MBC9755988.1 hypothetical protein [Klebsiella pneumoniae]